MANLIDKLVIKRHYIVTNEWNVLGLIRLINDRCNSCSKHRLVAGNCGWKDMNKWFVHFSCTDEQWRSIIDQLHKEEFELIVKNETRDVFMTRRARSPFKRIERECVCEL